MCQPYKIEPFGELVIPRDWLFYTPLAMRLRQANNEEALQDLCNIISRIRRSQGLRYYGILGGEETCNMSGTPRRVKK